MSNAAAHAALRDFQKALEKGSQEALKNTAEKAAEVLEARTLETFKAEASPEGKPWEPKQKPDGNKILHGKTGKLSTLWKAEAKQDEVSITSGVDYAVYHQKKRPMVPDDNLPKEYAKDIEEIFVEEMEANFK
jgi:phage gpG-like protein